jgi:hypothetical protein
LGSCGIQQFAFQAMGFVHCNQTQKKEYGKEKKFGAAHMLDIILRHWFLVDPSFKLPKFEDKDRSSTAKS